MHRTPAEKRLQAFDVLIGGLVGGIIIARAEHVLLNLAHFSFHRHEILQIQAGGLDWHGALVGAALGMALVLFWRKWLAVRRFWLVIMMLAAMLFFTGFLQGDYHLRVNQLRVSQCLDAIFFFYAFYLVFRIPTAA